MPHRTAPLHHFRLLAWCAAFWLVAASVALFYDRGRAGDPPAVSDWPVDCVDCPRRFLLMTDRSLAFNDQNRPLIAYGYDNLYFATRQSGLWQVTIVDGAPGTGAYASLALGQDGLAVISYHDRLNGSLKLARQTPNGWQTEEVDGAAVAGVGTSLRLDGGGYAHIGYGRQGATPADTSLAYAFQDQSGWRFETVDADNGSSPSLDLDAAGNPHLSYVGAASDHPLHYAFRDGALWRRETVVASGAAEPSLVLNQFGAVNLVFAQESGAGAHYLKLGYRAAAGWQVETIDDSTSYSFGHIGFALDSGIEPIISYQRMSPANNLMLAYWEGFHWEIVTVAQSVSLGARSSVAVNGLHRPNVTYYDHTSRELRLARPQLQNWSSELVDRAGEAGQQPDLALDAGGFPHISYQLNVPPLGLRYAFQNAAGWHVQSIMTGGGATASSIALDSTASPRVLTARSNELLLGRFDAAGWTMATLDAAGLIEVTAGALAIGAGDVAHVLYRADSQLIYGQLGLFGWLTETVAINAYNASLALGPDGRPHAAFLAGHWPDPRSIMYAVRSDTGWQAGPVETGNDLLVPTGPSIAVASGGRPHLAYVMPGGDVLRYAHHDGTSWQLENLDPAGAAAQISLGSDGLPRVAYVDRADGRLRFAARHPDGWHYQTAYGTAVARSPSLALTDGSQPRIAFYNDTTADLNLAYLGPGGLFTRQLFLPLLPRD